ncbi:MAG: fatty-acid oxidation protein subunit alpha [Spirochaetes bacterium GWF1_41_5]|nr:MAG: fatty-acid oxidation protein subunit alpha [Spirochaetes bacterium GWF1_41_5]HBE03893.1 fatty-acid oxidation protein subunit alpha [Spirochaetia bacterium]
MQTENFEPLLVKNSGYVFLKKVCDQNDGTLIIAEAQKDIPFDLKRVYYINNLKNFISVRGCHAHKTLRQVIFCIAGSFTLTLDDGATRQKILMNHDNAGIILGQMLWHEMSEFASGTVLLVFASDYYDEADYIRNYEEFTEICRKGGGK